MKHSNISIFIPHAGCPCQCSFCNQKTISGAQHSPSAEEVHEICRKALEEVLDRNNTEIAFFGGSFTAIDRTYMISLLEAAHEYIGENRFKGIRISTRPDFIDRETLDILKIYGVTAIELGAQSMVNKVLDANERGHTSEDVYNAAELIREYGFELGLQIMVGLYKSTVDDERATAKKIFEIHPDTLRIYPVVILKGTKLAKLYESGEYRLLDFDWVVDFCSKLLGFELEGIKIIKCGLHASEFVENDMIGGFYHPAFRELCENAVYRYNIAARIYDRDKDKPEKNYVIAVNSSCISKALGHKRSNAQYFKKFGIDIKIVGEDEIPKYLCYIKS